MDRFYRLCLRDVGKCAVALILAFGLSAAPVWARETRGEKQAKVQALRNVLVAMEKCRIELALRDAPLDDQAVRDLAIRIKAPLDGFRSAMKARRAEVEAILKKSGVDALEVRLAGGATKAGTAKELEGAIGKTVENLLAGFDMELAPSQTPTVVDAQKAYAEQCASCHGSKGAGDGELAKKLPSPVPSFVDEKRMRYVTPAYLFDQLLVGSPEKGMPSFAGRLDADTMWGLAHFLVGLRHGLGDKLEQASAAPPSRLSFTELAKKDDARLAGRLDAPALKAARTLLPFAKSTPRG